MKRGRPITCQELDEVHAKRTIPGYVYDVINGLLEDEATADCISYRVDSRHAEALIRAVMPEDAVFRKWWLGPAVNDEYKEAGIEVRFV